MKLASCIRLPLSRTMWLAAASAAMSVQPCPATFHFMQIEKVIGAVGGDPSAQALQLRMRFSAQHLVSAGRLIVRDATGRNGVVILDFQEDVPNDDAGARILIVSDNFYRYTGPEVEADFVLSNPIPASHLSAGSLTFETDNGDLIVWRFSWGGDAYTGSTGGAFTNDSDGEFGPPIEDGIDFDGVQAAVFGGPASALSSSNLADYTIESGNVVVINNAGEQFAVRLPDCAADPGADPLDSDGDGAGDLCDGCPDDSNKIEPGVCGCGVADFTAGGTPVADCGGDDDPPDNDNSNGNDNDTPPDNGNDNDVPTDNGNDNGGADNGNDNVGNDNSDNDDDDGDDAPPPGPRGCGVGMIPFWVLSLSALVALRLRRQAS